MHTLKKHNTIQNQILAGFLSVSISVMALLYITYIYFEKLQQVVVSKDIISEVYQKTFYLIYIDNRVLTEDITDSTFYTDKTSTLIEQHKTELKKIFDSFNQELYPELYRYSFDTDLDAAHKNLVRYDSLFNLILKIRWERGFKDYGLEGDFREDAHALENYNDIIPLEKLLSLRRHEKDYFLRHDLVYVNKFNTLCNSLTEDLEKKVKTNRLLEALTFLKAYQSTFNQVHSFEIKIGDKNAGLTNELLVCQNDISRSLKKIRRLAKAESAKIENTIYFHFALSVFSCIFLAILMTVLIVKLLARPIIKLAEVVEKPLPELLAIENLQNYFSSYSSYEIEKLQDALKTLINTIQNQIGQISTSNELLSLQNEELVGMNEKLSESESKLQEALFVKDKFFSIIAHDLKGPMASLTSFLKLFIRYNDSFSKEETKEVAQKMQASTESLSELLENLLTWSRAQIGHIQLKPVKVDLEEVVDKNFELILPKTSKKNISLIKEITPEIFLWADVDVLHFVLRNLLNNAVKFSHQDGKITVFSEVKGDFVWVSVKDEGVGMSEEMIQNLFNPRVKSSTKGTDNEQGTGLGLLLCKDFITSNRGEIWVESQENHGSIFTFLLPKYAYQWVEDGKKNKEAAKGN